MDISFLNIQPTKEAAFNLDESPLIEFRYLRQIQLIPFDPKPYWQVTQSKTPLSVGAYSVNLVRYCDEVKTDITDHVQITEFTENGITQLKIRIAYLLVDFGTANVYLEIDRYNNGTKFYYSNLFIVTANNSRLTARIDYVDGSRDIPAVTSNGFFQSIQLGFYYIDEVSGADVQTYYQITKNQVVNPRILQKEFKKWKTQIFDAWTFKKLIRAAYTGKFYINQIRNFPTEGFDIPEREGNTNISEMEFITDPQPDDVLTIQNVIIGPGVVLRDYKTTVGVPIASDGQYLITQLQIPE